MKALLICPAVRPAVAQLAGARPLAVVPLLGECLVNHWIEHVAALGAREVTILAADRPEQVRAAAGDGERWGVRVEVIATAVEISAAEAAARYRTDAHARWLPAPHDIVVMSHLPGRPEQPLFDSQAAWFGAVVAWMPHALTQARVRVREVSPGIWVGRRARVSPRARLIAPCWIGDQVFVAPHAVVGDGAVVEDRAVIEAGARVRQSYVAPDTFVGRMTSVTHSLALGGTLVNWQSDSALRVPDPFLLCSLARTGEAAAGHFAPRMRRLLVRAAAAPFNFFATWTARPERAADLKLPG